MRKTLTVVLSLLLTCAVFAQAPDQKLHTDCLYPTIMVLDHEGKSGGTGFIVRSVKHGTKYRNSYITAAHVVDGDGPFVVNCIKYKKWSQVDKETKYPTFICHIHNGHDIAFGVFETDEPMPVAKLDFDHELFMDTKVCRIGFGLMDDARIDHGLITQPFTSRPQSFLGSIRTNVYSVAGDSGGPLILNYKVIGVCKAVRNYKDQLMTAQSYFTDIRMLKSWDKEADNCLSQLYTDEQPLPVLPFVKLELQRYQYKIPK